MTPFWTFFIDKRAFSYILITALIVSGSYALLTIPKESAPEVKVPIGIVTTTLPGASAEDTEKLITNKIEDEVNNVDNLDKLTSSSREGVSIISVQFLASADIDKSINDLKDAVDRAKPDLPKEANSPIVTKVSFSDQPILIVSISSDITPPDLVRLGDTLKEELKTVGGVSRVEVSGVRDRQAQVVVRKEALDTYGIRLVDVISALSAANASLPIGSITVDGIDYAVKFNGSIDNPSEIGDIVLTTKNGTPIYVRDVALVSDGLEKATTFSRVSLKGVPSEQALTLSVFKRSGGDVTKISSNVKSKLNDLKKTTLSGSQVVISFDRGDLVQKDLTELSRVGLETVLLVMLVLFLTIGWRESVVAGLAIPLSFLMAFVGLLYSGNSINFVSLFSLILAIGILVDSGIVMTEAIHTRYKKFGDAREAAIASLREYSWPLFAGTMTTVAVFVPLFFISGITGQFIASIPFTIIFVLLASIFVALGIVPLIAILFTKRSLNRFEALQESYNDIVREWYKKFLRNILENKRVQKRFLWVVGILFVITLSFPIVGIVKVTFFPQDNIDYLYIELQKPEGTPLAYTDQAIRQIEEILYDRKKFPEIASFVTTVGQSSSFSTTPASGAKIANITINLINKKDRTRTSAEMVEAIRKEVSTIKSADIRVEEPNNGPPSGAPVLIKITGEDFGDLDQTAINVEHILQNIPGTININTSNTNGGTEFALTVDRAKASELGLNPQVIAQTLRSAVNGTIATTIKTVGKDIDVVVKLNLNGDTNPDTTTEATIDALRQIPIETQNGPVLLGSVITATIQKSNAVINHEDKKRIITVSSDLKVGVTAPEINSAFDKKKSELHIPDGVTVAFAGENDDVNKSFREMFIALVAGLVLMLGILVLVFNSFRYTSYLIVIVPLSLIGVMTGLAISFKPLSFPSILGFIALAGIIINHAIILLDSMVHYLADHKTESLIDIVVESAATRLRPIVLTTVTTVVGMVPLAGASALWGPIAFTIMFGLTFSMVLSLIFIPVLFYRSPKVRRLHGNA
jgi:multidrug efflux pump